MEAISMYLISFITSDVEIPIRFDNSATSKLSELPTIHTIEHK